MRVEGESRHRLREDERATKAHNWRLEELLLNLSAALGPPEREPETSQAGTVVRALFWDILIIIVSPSTPALRNRPQRAQASSSSQNSLRNRTEGPSPSHQVWNALHELGYDSLASVLDCLLKSGSISNIDCRQMLLKLLQCQILREEPATGEDRELCEE